MKVKFKKKEICEMPIDDSDLKIKKKKRCVIQLVIKKEQKCFLLTRKSNKFLTSIFIIL